MRVDTEAEGEAALRAVSAFLNIKGEFDVSVLVRICVMLAGAVCRCTASPFCL